ncbi:MAG: hypothetical protein N3E51_05045, partial [Candidatus Micrarchaeota archaeon]|nr:hypothetical protein [Candidatus Micrarchaeota archaeon]
MRAGKAQASVELISILGIALLVILVFAVLASDMLTDLLVQKDYNDAYESVRRLAAAADSVYAQGEGASATVMVTLPTTTNFHPDLTFVGKPSYAPAGAPANQININVDGTDVSAFTKARLVGSFPASAGTYPMKVVSRGSYVAIGTYFIEASKYAIFESMGQDESRVETITFSAVTNQTVSVLLNYTWGYSNVELAADALAFNVSSGSPVSVNFTITSDDDAAGIYNGELKVVGQ